MAESQTQQKRTYSRGGRINDQDEPKSEGEISPTEDEMTNVVYFKQAVYEERDENKPYTPPSPCYPKYEDHPKPTPQSPTNTRREDLEMIPQTPPKEQNKKPSPITWSPARNKSTKRPVKERLGTKLEYDETPRRPSNNGPRRSKIITEHEPFKEGCAPPKSSEFPRALWYQDKDGYWFKENYCSEDEEKDKLGNAEPSEEEGSKE